MTGRNEDPDYGNVYVLMPDPKVRRPDDPCRLWIVTSDDVG